MPWDKQDKFEEQKLPDEPLMNRHRPDAGWPRRGRDTFTCPDCGARTTSQMKHCSDCGRPLSYTCPKCGMEFRYEYQQAFCPECGAELKQPVWEGANRPSHGPVSTAGKVIEFEEEIK